MSKTLSIDILQAEGQLNREITSALNQFRKKITEDVNKSEDQLFKEQYQIKKGGTQKQFAFRQSLLSLKFFISDYKTLYNMMAASFIILTFTLVYDSYITKGTIIDEVTLYSFFRGWQTVFMAWWILVLIHSSIILVVKVGLSTSKIIWLPLYLTHQALLYGYPIYIIGNHTMGFASIFILACQGIRMVMKSHSYFRTKLLYIKQNEFKNFTLTEKEQPSQIKITFSNVFQEVQRLSYFFFAPTLLYRDSYTLTCIRSLPKMIAHFINFIACIYYSFILYLMCCKEPIENLEKKLDFSTILLTIIKLMLPSMFFLILGFFGFLHSWLNLWAEITRFPDRGFYSDWWNSIEFGSYYRKWNIVVHDWLYCYIYVDLRRFFPSFNRSRLLSQLMTFLISAIIHQVIVCLAIGFFYPILFLLFTGPGIILIQNQRRLKSISINLVFWLQMYIGTALLFSCYLVQIFAREVVKDQIIINDFPLLHKIIPRTYYLGQS